MREEKTFSGIVSALAAQGEFIAEGEPYKRNHYSGSMEPVAGWYNRKNIFAVHNSERIDDIFDFASLSDRLRRGFAGLAELYHFIQEAIGPERDYD